MSLLSLAALVLALALTHGATIKNRDVLEEHEVAQATRSQIVSMSKAGITHDRIVTHLRKFHFQDKSDAELRDIAHLEKDARLPKGLQTDAPKKKKTPASRRSASKPTRRRR